MHQGFVFYVGQVASMFLSAFFAIQLVLHVRYGWKEARLKQIERVFLFLGTVLPIAMATFLVSQGAMNISDSGVCYIDSNPRMVACQKEDRKFVLVCPFEQEPKRWWEHSELYLVVGGTGIVLLALGTIFVSMILLYSTARQRERRATFLYASSMSHTNGPRPVVPKVVMKTGSFYLGERQLKSSLLERTCTL
jgi:hypothetical protein